MAEAKEHQEHLKEQAKKRYIPDAVCSGQQ